MATAKLSDELDYETWAPATKSTLTEKGLWDVVENGIPSDPSKVPESSGKIQYRDLSEWRKLVKKDMDALEILQSSLPDSVFRKTLSASSAKDVWDLLKKGNQQAKVVRLEKEFEQLCMGVGGTLDAEYVLLLESDSDLTYDENMWMICAKGTMNHMTPYEKYFTSLDTTHKAKVRTLEGNVLAVQGRGDVKVVMKGGKKKTIKNVLFVPELNRNVVSFRLLIARGYRQIVGPTKFYFEDRTGAEFGKVSLDERGLALRLQVAGVNEEEETGPLIYDEDWWNVSFSAEMHMTPYDKVFTTLDTTQKARAVMPPDGRVMMVEGRGDVKFVMKGGKEMTITKVLFIPGIPKNVLSLSLMEAQAGRELLRSGEYGKCLFADETGAEYGETRWDGDDLALRLQVIKK